VAAVLIRWIIQIIGVSCRVRTLVGEGRLEELRVGGTPVIFSFWHNRSLFLAYLLHRRLLGRGYPITILVSLSRDGELGARLARRWGAEVVRGSASRGGTAGLRQLYRAVRQEGRSAVTIPDGPRGPLYEAKAGAVVLAQMSGAPIQPMAFAAESYWTIKSWDRLIIPKPFSRIWLALGDPLEVSKEMTAETTETERLRLQKALNDLVQRTEDRAAGSER
jgi:lysophospholipid acyltransferase (LPLAT)-like uncharacterized protein